jgi:hypothetical protein
MSEQSNILLLDKFSVQQYFYSGYMSLLQKTLLAHNDAHSRRM